jgi:hypothetical protein
LEQAKAADEARRQQGVNPEKNPGQIPITDPESRVMPNKEGGYALNYTPTATTDGQYGFIVDVNVLSSVEEDQYYCPMGHALPFSRSSTKRRCGKRAAIRLYQSRDCAGCPLAGACLGPQVKYGRTITRDEYEEVRERTAVRMSSASAKAIYNQRPWIAETTFGILKHIMGLRQFLLRGLENRSPKGWP